MPRRATGLSSLSIATAFAVLVPAAAEADPWEALERSAAPRGITLEITPMTGAAPEPEPAEEDGDVACMPTCRAGFTCMSGICVSACNPVCGAGEQCTADGNCVTRPAVATPVSNAPARPEVAAPALLAAPPTPPTRAWAAMPAEGWPAGLEATTTAPARTGLPSRRALFPLTLPRRVFSSDSALTYVRTEVGEGDVYEALTLGQSFSWGMSDRVTLSVSPLAVSLRPEVDTTGDLRLGLRGQLAQGTVELALGAGLGVAPDGSSTSASIPLLLRVHLGAVAAITTGLVTHGFLMEGSDPSWGSGTPLDLTLSLGGSAFARVGTSWSWNAVAERMATLPLDAQLGVLFVKDGHASGELAVGLTVPDVLQPYATVRSPIDTVALGVSLALYTRPARRS